MATRSVALMQLASRADAGVRDSSGAARSRGFTLPTFFVRFTPPHLRARGTASPAGRRRLVVLAVSRAVRSGEARGVKLAQLSVALAPPPPWEEPLAPLRTRLAPPPPLHQPQPQLYVLASGGKGLGKAECVGSVVQLVSSVGATGWVTVRLVSVALRSRGGNAALRVGDEMKWRRSALRELLPNNKVAAQPPTSDQMRAAAVAAPTVAPLAPPPLPPLMPTLLGELRASVARVVVLFDLEGNQPITEMAATAVYALADGTWGVPPNGRFGTHVNHAKSFSAAASDLNSFLERMSAGAGGAPLAILAHNGPASDWRKLSYGLASIGSSLPACVESLGCTHRLFVAEQAEALGRLWSMKAVYAARFGAKIPNVHQALGDVSAMERILVHSISVNGTQWALQELDAAVMHGMPPAMYIEKYAAEFPGVQQVAAASLAAKGDVEVAVPPPPPEYDEFDKLRAACGAAFGAVPQSRGELLRALRAAAALPAAVRAAAPALERAARADRIRLPAMLCTSLLSGLELLRPVLERALEA